MPIRFFALRGAAFLFALICALVPMGCLLFDESCDYPVESTPVAQVNNGAWSVTDAMRGNFVQLVDANRGYALNGVSQSGGYSLGLGGFVPLMRETRDGGRTWTPLQGGLSKVYFTDLNTGWAVGLGGAVYKTVNGGNTWTAQNSGTTENLSAVHFPAAGTGYAIGEHGTVLKTVDGGIAWTKQNSSTKKDLYSVYFTSVSTGYAVGDDGLLLKTANGGASWTVQKSAVDGYFYSLSFVDADHGWAVGMAYKTQWDLVTLRTTNGGKTWPVASSGVDRLSGLDSGVSVEWVSSVHFLNATTGWVLIGTYDWKSDGQTVETLLKTTDAGVTWKLKRQAPVGYARGTFSFPDADNGWLAGGDSLFVTHNAGETWSGLPAPFEEAPTSLHFESAETGWATDEWGTIFKTVNGGGTWTVQRGGLPGTVNAFYFLDSSRGWAVGADGLVAKTTDGGELWKVQPTASGENLGAVHFTDPLNGHTVGQGGTILATVDGGGHWVTQTSGSSNTLNGVHFTSASTGFAVGAGSLLKTVNGGEVWTAQSAGTLQPLRSVYFADAAHGWVVGGESSNQGDNVKLGGLVLRTTDGGVTWSGPDSVGPVGLHAVAFVDANVGYAVGGGIPATATPPPISNPSCGYKYTPELLYYQQILKTTDGGISWTAEKTTSVGKAYNYLADDLQSPFTSVSCVTSGACATLGSTGAWLRP